MPINVKGLFETLQYKANNIDSSTSTAEILDTLKAIKLADGNTVISYDSDGALPDATTTNVKLVYVKSTGIIKFNNGTWDTLTGSLDGTAATSYTFQGSTSGYTSGGGIPSPYINNIEKFSFSVDGNATDVGDLLVETAHHAGQSSTNNGYSSGGNPSPLSGNTIVKFPFSTDTNATDVGDLINAFRYVTGQSSANNGYTSGGYISGLQNVIQKFPFSSDGNATDVGDLTNARQALSGQSSSDNGYSAGGMPYTNVIDKFPFSTDANATDVGDLTNSPRYVTGQSSADNGYASGGNLPALSNVIQKWSFASDANATDVGDTTAARFASSGQSSTASGYTSGGFSPLQPGPGTFNIIDKFPFATDANATDVGDLVTSMAYSAGQQV